MTDPTADRPAQQPPMPPVPAPFPTAPAFPAPSAFPTPEPGPGGFAALDPERDPFASSTAPQTSAPVPTMPSTAAPSTGAPSTAAAQPAAPQSVYPAGQMTPPAGYSYPTAYGGAYAGYGVPATGPYVVYPQPKTNGMAVASMVVSIVGALLMVCYGVGGLLGAVGAVLGHISRRQIRERSESGDGMAIAGIVVGWVSFGLSVVIIGLFVALFAFALTAAPPTPS